MNSVNFDWLPQRIRRRRGFRVWMFLLGMGLFSAAGWLRLSDTLNDWYWLEQVARVAPGPLYLAVTGALWGVAAALAVLWVFLQLRNWRLAGVLMAVFLAITYWADRLLLTRAEDGMFNAGFALLLTLLGLAFAVITLRPWKREENDGIQRSGN